MSEIPRTDTPCGKCDGHGTVSKPDREALRRARKDRGVTQVALAAKAGWTKSMVSEIETGARPLTESSARRYTLALSLCAPLSPQVMSDVSVSAKEDGDGVR